MTDGHRDPLHALPLGSPEWLAELQRRFPRAYARWTAEEEKRLIDAFRAGKAIDEIAVVHGRTPGGVLSRLTLVGALDELAAARSRDREPAVICDGCDVALDEYDIFCFWSGPAGEHGGYLELCAACMTAAMRHRTSGPSI